MKNYTHLSLKGKFYGYGIDRTRLIGRITVINHRLMNLSRFFSLVLVLFFMAGCAGTTQTIEHAKNLSTSGIAYSEAVSRLIDEAVDRVIEDDSDAAIRIRKRSPDDQLEGNLQDLNDALKPLVDALGSFKATTSTMTAYFEALQDLADSSEPENIGPAVGSLVDSINGANQTIKNTDTVVISDTEKGFIEELGNIAAKSVQAGLIHDSLKDSAEIIGEQLVLQELLLKDITAILKDSYQIEMNEQKNKIIEAYRNKSVPIGADWKIQRKDWLKSSFHVEQLDSAVTAAQNMQEIWKKILEGGNDPESLSLLIADINEVAEALNALKEEREKRDNEEG